MSGYIINPRAWRPAILLGVYLAALAFGGCGSAPSGPSPAADGATGRYNKPTNWKDMTPKQRREHRDKN
jgi:hypothetical protein